MSTTSAQAELARHREGLLAVLNAGPPYCVVGSGRSEEHADRDVDIVVRPADLHSVAHLIARYCAETGGCVVNVIHQASDGLYFVCRWPGAADERTWLYVDVYSDLTLGTHTYLRAAEILRDRRRDGGGWVAAGPVEFVYSLIKKVREGELPRRYDTLLSAAWREDPDGAASQIARFWPDGEAAVIRDAVERNGWDDLRAHLPALRSSLRSRREDRLRSALIVLRRFRQRVRHPTGLSLAVLGIDGTGKTSAIREAMRLLTPAFNRQRYVHFRPGLLRPERRDPGGDYPTRVRKRPLGSSMARLAFYLVDYWVGFLGLVWPHRIRTGLVVFDRYFYDLSIDPIRLRHRGLMRVARLLERLVPRPDLLVLFDAPPELTRARQSQVPPLTEATRQRRALLATARRRDALIVDASASPETLAAQLEEYVLTFLTERTSRRRPFLSEQITDLK